jgi:hypothetical protein
MCKLMKTRQTQLPHEIFYQVRFKILSPKHIIIYASVETTQRDMRKGNNIQNGNIMYRNLFWCAKTQHYAPK